MKIPIRPRLSLPNILAGVAIALVLTTGTAYASSQITGANVKNSSLTGADIKNSSLTGADIRNSSLTGADIRNGSLTGNDILDNSITANNIPDFTLTNEDVGVLFARVNADGTLASSSGGVTSVSTGLGGEYVVNFGRDVTACAFVATQGDASSAPGAIMGVTENNSGSVNAVVVTTRSDAATSLNRSFQLIAVC